MDEIVQAALNKWPDVPHCYAWLALDARGVWRMRDERAQALGLPGDKIRNATLLGFINRNYQGDEQGRWYFQNGPQRVYVDLEATPYICHTVTQTQKPAEGIALVLHTEQPLHSVTEVFLSADGKLILRAADCLAQLDDRDLATCLNALQLDGKPAQDEDILHWLEAGSGSNPSGTAPAILSIQLATPQPQRLTVQHGELSQLMAAGAYVARPRADE